LQQTNEFFAMRLANRAFARFVLRLLLFPAEFEQYANSKPQGLDSPDIGPVARALSGKLGADKHRLVELALERQAAINALTQPLRAHWANLQSREALEPNQLEVEILRAILNYKASVHASEEWSLSATGLYEVVNDFHLLHDFYFGRQTQPLARLAHMYGTFFLASCELQEYNAIPGNEGEKRLSFLKEHAQPRIRPLWYFMVSLCRLLQTADHVFSAEEAYWLGLVDEILGSKLSNERELVERLP
jgi:hypothetical protein